MPRRKRGNYIPLTQRPIDKKKLKKQLEHARVLNEKQEQKNIMEQLRQNRLQRKSQNQSANQEPFTIKQKQDFKNCKELDEMVDLITSIYKNNNESYTTSTELTNDIIKLKKIVEDIEGNPGISIKKAVEKLDNSIKHEETGLSNSYLMIKTAIEMYAKTIKCPKKEESLDDIINYFYNWTERNRSVYDTILLNMGELDFEKNKEKFPFPQIIFPLYIIIKSLLHRNLYNSSGTRSSRTRNTKNIINIKKYLNPHLNAVAKKYLESIFAPFFDRYFKPDTQFESKNKRLIFTKKSSSQPQLLQYNISPLGKKTFKEYFERPDLNTFIKNFENLLEILPYIDQNAFKEHFNTGENKTFKKHLYESILNHDYNYIGPHFSYGGKIISRKPWTNVDFDEAKNKGFRQWFEMILSRKLTGVNNFPNYDRTFRKTRKNITDQGERDKLRSQLGISNERKNKTQGLRVETPIVRKRVRNKAWEEYNPPPPKKSNNKTKKKREENKNQPLRAKTPPLGQNDDPVSRSGVINIPDDQLVSVQSQNNQINETPSTNRKRKSHTHITNQKSEFSEKEKKRAIGANYIRRYKGGNKTKKRKRKKRNTTTNKKKKHTKRNKKRHNKNKYTKKNK